MTARHDIEPPSTLPLIRRGQWRSAAACRFSDPEMFFPIADSGPAQEQIAIAKAVCATCQVRRESNSPGRGTTPPRPGRAARPATSSGPSAGPTATSSHDASPRIDIAVRSRPVSPFRPRESGHPDHVTTAHPARRQATSGRLAGWREQAEDAGAVDRLGATVYAELGEEVTYMRPDRMH
jgi:hypothetical protein